MYASAHASDGNGDASVGLVLLAGGQGRRMQSETPKQYLSLRSVPMALRCADTLARVDRVRFACIVCDDGWREMFEMPAEHSNEGSWAFRELLVNNRVAFATPGEERQGSVENGFHALTANFPQCDVVAIHDGARPLVREQRVDAAIDDALDVGASALASQCKATIKRADKNTGIVFETLDRSELWEMHTPQIAHLDVISKALHHANKTGLLATDDAALVEAAGMPVKVTDDAYDNIKVTTPDDMPLAERALEAQLSEGETGESRQILA